MESEWSCCNDRHSNSGGSRDLKFGDLPTHCFQNRLATVTSRVVTNLLNPGRGVSYDLAQWRGCHLSQSEQILVVHEELPHA
jgi:hypothetical protein